MKHTTAMQRVTGAAVAAALLALLLPSGAAALFGGKKEDAPTGDAGAPIAQNLDIKAYRGVAYTGTLSAVDNEGEAVTFRLETLPAKGALEFGEEGVFVYTPDAKQAGSDSFTFVAIDASGNVSAPATVKIKIARVSSGVSYADTAGTDCATAAVELAERGIFVGARVGGDWFFEPERAVTRGEFVTMALAAAGINPSDVTVTGFCDDDAIPTWAKGSAAAALAAGVVQGTATKDGVAFHAARDVTLSEAAAMLDRILRVTDVALAEADDAAAWYAQAVANLESVRVVPAGSFGDAPGRGVTRGEAARLLSAAMALADAREGNTSFWRKLF